MKKLLFTVIVALTSAFPAPALAQQNPLVGAWERVSQTNDTGVANPQPYMLVIFSEDGVFTMVNIAKGRPKTPKPVGELTPEELRSRFAGVQAVYGTYTVVGNRLTRNVVGALNPNNEGQQISDLFRIEGDTLVGWDPASMAESRLKRIRNGTLSAR